MFTDKTKERCVVITAFALAATLVGGMYNAKIKQEERNEVMAQQLVTASPKEQFDSINRHIVTLRCTDAGTGKTYIAETKSPEDVQQAVSQNCHFEVI